LTGIGIVGELSEGGENAPAHRPVEPGYVFFRVSGVVEVPVAFGLFADVVTHPNLRTISP
jgi:hypothetical protein